MVELIKDKRETPGNLNKYYGVGTKMDENTNVQSMVNNKYLLVCHRIK